MAEVPTEGKLQEAVQTVAVAAGHASTADAAIEAAIEAREDAEELAEDIADAAMEAARGQRIEALERELASWPEKLTSALAALRTEFLAMVETVKAGAAQTPPVAEATTAQLATAAATTEAVLSGQASTAAVTETATATVQPEAVSAEAAAVQEAAPLKRKPKFL